MGELDIPATLNEALATEPSWLQLWVLVLVVTNLAGIFFVIGKAENGWKVRAEPIGILISFFVAAVIMNWMYGEFGYVRLLGLAHLIAWLPVYAWIVTRRGGIGSQSVFGKYIHLYLVVAGVSLIVDLIDVIRYLIGDGELFNRWAAIDYATQLASAILA
jgi:hypothetical protein